MSSKINSNLELFIAQVSQSIPSQDNIDTASLQYALNNIEALGIAAGENKRLGFQDICFLVQETYSDIIETNNTLSSTQLELLKRWPILASNHLKNSTHSTADALTNFFNNSDLSTSLEEADLNVLNDMLSKEANKFQTLFSEIITNIRNNKTLELGLLNEKLEELLLSLNEENLMGFLDVCLLFQENITDLEQDNNGINDTQKNMVLEWLNQAELFLSSTNNSAAASALVANLKQDEWPTPLAETDANVLLEMFGVQTKDSSPNIPDALVNVFNKLQRSVAEVEPHNKDSILNVANNSEEIGLAAGELDLLGFQDVCFLIKEFLSDIADDSKSSLEQYIQHIKQWLSLVKNYLVNPNSTDAIQNILEYLSDEQWPNPMAQADLDIIQEMMGAPPEANEVIEPEAANIAAPTNSTTVSTNERLQEEFNEILDDVIETKDILAAPHGISKDLVKMLQEEATIIRDEILSHIELIKNEDTEAEVIVDSLSQYALHVERFGSACQAAEMDGLYQIASVFTNNINYFSNNEAKFTEHQLSLLTLWPQSVLSYLQNPGDNVFSSALVDIVKDKELPNNLMTGVAPALINLLKAVYVSEVDIHKEARQTEAKSEDVSIELPEDINQELLDGLLQELPGQTEGFSAAIQALIDGSGDISEVHKAQRIAHTVKGAANTVGVKGIAILTHQLEDIMSSLNDLNHLPSPALAASFMDAADCLEEMSEALLERGTAPSNSQNVLQSILDWAIRLEKEGVDCLKSEENETIEPVTAKPKEEDIEKENDDSDASAILRVPANLIDEILRLLGETMIVTSQLQERVRLSTMQSQRLVEHQNSVKNLASDLEVQVDVKSAVQNNQQSADQDTVFDSLELEEYNELHTVTHRIVEAADDSYELNQEVANDLRELDELLVDKLRLHNEIQGIVMRTRMVAIKTISPRLQRIVRQTCRSTKKEVSLEIIGSDTLIDSDILNKLIDPLMHILRNAIDHGIENREQRIHLKKDPEGKLQLTFVREGTQILVKCQDDGSGLDRKDIIDTAIKRGLLRPDEQFSENKINRLILNPGFSTREKATQTSGRGVGMDIVHTELLAMKGSVHIESKENKGCLIELRMPLTLMSSHALLLRHLNNIIAVSNHGIEKILHPSDSQIIETDHGLMCEVDGEKLKMQSLESLLNLPEDRRGDTRETRPALLIRDEELNHVIYIQEVVDTRDLFIKSMGKYINNIKGMLGATILGDGSVIPVIDLPELIRAPVTILDKPDELTHSNIHRALPVALVVDDSLSARRALTQVIQDAGFDVRTAKDGLEAVGIIENKKPNIMLVDMEMPRMNGMELTSHVRGLENTKDIPVIMITSRSTDKHRKQAEAAGVNIYVTKPFSEDDLLDHVHSLLV
tara:strand:- start:48003 stop:52139 length:4137 start_codon:yes stop_codon:yes gene_type:complete